MWICGAPSWPVVDFDGSVQKRVKTSQTLIVLRHISRLQRCTYRVLCSAYYFTIHQIHRIAKRRHIWHLLLAIIQHSPSGEADFLEKSSKYNL